MILNTIARTRQPGRRGKISWIAPLSLLFLVFHCLPESPKDHPATDRDSNRANPSPVGEPRAEGFVERSVERPTEGILFLGDSITQGFRLPPELAYPSQLERRFLERRLPLHAINGGVSGDTTRDGLARLPFLLKKDRTIQHLVIELGYNDALEGRDPAAMEEDLRAILRLAKKERPGIRIYLFRLAPFSFLDGEYRRGFSNVFNHLKKVEGLILLPDPMEGITGQAELLQQDGLHPNAKGAAILVENVWRALADLPELRPLFSSPSP